MRSGSKGAGNIAMLSVIICTHNPRPAYLERCLNALREQSLDATLWELVLVDNASAPAKAPDVDLSWHPRARVVHEAKLGLTPARLRGIGEAVGELLVFVDDDNVLDADYLENALHVANEKRFLGSWSGQCRPEFEQPPPSWTQRYWGNLVIRQFDSDVWSNVPRLANSMPAGAGLCVRREVARSYAALHQAGKRSVQLDRTGDSLVSGGDNDLAECACDIGMGVGLIACLKLTHLISAERLTEAYLTKLTEGIYFSSTLLDAERGVAPAPRGLVGRVADTMRVLRQKGPHRRILKAAYRGRERARQVLSANGASRNAERN